MAEANARREARMRRILENSENRLLKITGTGTVTNSEEASTAVNKTSTCLGRPNEALHLNNELHEQVFTPNMNGVTSADKFEEDEEEWNYADKDKDIPTRAQYKTILSPLYSCKQPEINDRLDASPERISGRLKFDQHNSYDRVCAESPTMSGINDNHRSMKEQTLTLSILRSRANYVILAIIVNMLLLLNLDHLFGKAIIIPGLTMIVARLYTCRNAESQKGSLLIAALILCNVRPELTYNIKKLMSLFTMILHDLALYIFSFVLVYYGASYCKWYFNNRIELDH